jgi:retinol dehydrogenase-12
VGRHNAGRHEACPYMRLTEERVATASNNVWTIRHRVVLLTGATDGIGRVAARELADRGARVVIVGRNRRKTERTVEEIVGATGNSDVDFMLADLSSQEAIRGLAREFRERYDRLDVLINNAGDFFIRRQESVDGIEMTFALNHLAYFLLTNLLLDLIINNAPARIINVSSAAHRRAEIKLDDVEAEEGYSGWQAYGESKLANVLFTYELARRLEGTGVTANALHPGFVATNLGADNFGFLGSLVRKIINLRGISPEKGAQTIVYLAASPEVQGVSGEYFVKQKPVETSPVTYDEALATALWEISAEMTDLDEAAVATNGSR